MELSPVCNLNISFTAILNVLLPYVHEDSSVKSAGDAAANENEWGEFLHLPGEKFYDFSKIRAEIVRDTELKTGKNAGVYPEVTFF